MGHEFGELTIEELQETQRNVSPSEQEEDERGPMPISAIKDLLKKWEDVRAMVLEWHSYQADVSSTEDPPCRGGRCMLNMSRLKRPPVGVVWKLGEEFPVSPSLLDHGSKLRGPSPKAHE
ncbi:uncharacterized protein TNCV_2669321 [Trichonephila clavipes]|nr:uncharacterized protein TNCV_2669321 [Trichonephila clavipes]